MNSQLLLPVSAAAFEKKLEMEEHGLDLEVKDWFDSKIMYMKDVWQRQHFISSNHIHKSLSILADEIYAILSHRTFNFQSKKKNEELKIALKATLAKQIIKGEPLKFFLLYNGGYRASPLPKLQPLIFESDQTEMMLLYQITLLQEKISEVYAQGIEFNIVINNGVAFWVNNIALSDTEKYSNTLQHQIEFFGAQNRIKILLQSELITFHPDEAFQLKELQENISENNHELVERFLGKTCNREEAKYRFNLYQVAEEKWGKEINDIVNSQDGVILRQIADSHILSFRAFPGAAIRAQNGTLGFQLLDGKLVPKLVTTFGIEHLGVKFINYQMPISISKEAWTKF